MASQAAESFKTDILTAQKWMETYRRGLNKHHRELAESLARLIPALRQLYNVANTLNMENQRLNSLLQKPSWTFANEGLPDAPGNYIVILRADNVLGWSHHEPHGMSFDEISDQRKAFHFCKGYEIVDCTEDVICWARMPLSPILTSGTET